MTCKSSPGCNLIFTPIPFSYLCSHKLNTADPNNVFQFYCVPGLLVLRVTCKNSLDFNFLCTIISFSCLCFYRLKIYVFVRSDIISHLEANPNTNWMRRAVLHIFNINAMILIMFSSFLVFLIFLRSAWHARALPTSICFSHQSHGWASG